jgi:hypothetical protein
MRTKTLLAALMAAGVAASAVAQSNVYSLNVVGYYNVVAPANTKIILGNQLDTTNNTLVGVIPNPPPSSQFFKYNSGFSGFTFDDIDLAWTGNTSLAPGEGGFFISPTATTLTFVGEVRQGSLTNTLPTGTKVIRTSIVPQAGRVTADLGLPGEANDQLFQWNNVSGGYTGYTFDDIDLAWVPNDPTNAVGGAFFYIKAGTNPNWVRNFTVQ